jgi:hypothetical protein
VSRTRCFFLPLPCGEGRRARASRGGGLTKAPSCRALSVTSTPPPDRRFATATLPTLSRGRDKNHAPPPRSKKEAAVLAASSFTTLASNKDKLVSPRRDRTALKSVRNTAVVIAPRARSIVHALPGGTRPRRSDRGRDVDRVSRRVGGAQVVVMRNMHRLCLSGFRPTKRKQRHTSECRSRDYNFFGTHFFLHWCFVPPPNPGVFVSGRVKRYITVPIPRAVVE